MHKDIELVAAGIVLVVLLFILYKVRTRKLKVNYYQIKWQRLQKLCSDKKTWYRAVIDADELLDEVLRKQHMRGRSTGERLVSAQRRLTNNDAVWFGHKLKKRIKEEDFKKLNKKDAIQALAGFRQALMDLKALTPDIKVEDKK
jgi:hypothetical protein